MRFTRITLFFIAAIITVGFYQLARHFLAEVEPQTFQATEEVMVDTARLLAEIVEPSLRGGTFRPDELRAAFDDAHGRKFEARIFQHVKRSFGMHAYLTDARGVIIFDSEGGLREGEDYSSKRDVSLTLRGEYGARSTPAEKGNAGSPVLHVAAPVGDPASPLGVLTVCKPQRDVMAFVTERRRIIYVACALIGGGILFLIAAVFLWLFRPIGRITEYARAIERGERPPKPKIGIGREVNTLARALDSMRDALEGRRYAERYIRSLTHEMKSPLAAIRGAAELLDEDMPDDTRRRFLANIRAETARSERMITRLLELSAVESLARLETTGNLDLCAVVAAAIDLAKPLAEVGGVRLRHTPPDAPVVTRGDPFILRSAVTNLLENAIDFSPPEGEVEITIIAGDSGARIQVRDHGSGIPDFAKEKVFERFYSLRHHTTGRKGTGLGLPLVREAADLHGGSITLETPADGGTLACLTLPLFH